LRWIKFTDVHWLPVFVEAVVVGVEWFWLAGAGEAPLVAIA
jgi:hypothetical protein